MAKQKEVKTNAMRMLERMKIPFTHLTYECKEFEDGIQIADMLGLPHEKVYKTLVTVGASKNYFVFVIPIEAELDLKAAARSVGEKSVAMIPMRELLPLTGYIHGGCSPVGMKKPFPTAVDETAMLYDTIVVSAGKIGQQVELAPSDLIGLTKGCTANIVTEV